MAKVVGWLRGTVAQLLLFGSRTACRGWGREPWLKLARNGSLAIGDEHYLWPEVCLGAGDWIFERFETVVDQDLVLTRRNTRFVRARYRSRLTGESVLAPQPQGYHQGGSVLALASARWLNR